MAERAFLPSPFLCQPDLITDFGANFSSYSPVRSAPKNKLMLLKSCMSSMSCFHILSGDTSARIR